MRIVILTDAEWNAVANALMIAITKTSSDRVTLNKANLLTAREAMSRAAVMEETPKARRIGTCECGTIPCSCTFTHY